MSRLTLTLLGTFQASVSEQSVIHFATDKTRALLAYLAVETDRPHRRDTLAALLWPDRDDAGARSNLRLALHRLREALDAAAPALSDDLFGVTRDTVQVNGAALDLDVAHFVALLEMCELHPHRLLHLCPSCLSQLGEAAALYGGELLAGLSIADAPGFEQWELMRREELGQRVLSLLHRLTEAFEQLGDYGRGLIFAHRQLALDPYREEAHRQAMRLYALQGERAAALVHYDRVRTLLAEELSVEPDVTTTGLAEQIRAGQLVGAVSVGRPLLYHFPAQFTPFFGRASEIAHLADLLADPTAAGRDVPAGSNPPQRLYTIVAPGGMGKTRLAVAAAEALAQRPGYPDGLHFLSLARTASADLLPSALAGVLGLNLSGAAEPADQLAAFLRTRTTLLVLDNFEHLIEGTDLVVRLLEEAPGLRLLLTSREALNIRAEERFVLGGLDEEVTARLFISAAARVRPGYDPDPAERAAIDDICHAVGGMPLAIELAATWVRLMDAPAIAAQISRDLDFLTTSLRDLPPRQRSMRVIFDGMWAQLSPPAAAALAALSVLRGPFRLDAAEAVSRAAPRVLAQLLDQSLLRSSDGGRFEIHELLRQYAAERLAASPEAETAAREAHAGHYLALLAERGAALGGPESKAALALLRRNLANVREAWVWSAESGRHEAIAAAARPLETFYRFSGLLAEGVTSFAAAAAALEVHIERGDPDPSAGYPVVYGLWRRKALLLELMGRSAAALERLAHARDGWRARGDRRQEARTLNEMSYVNIRNLRLDAGHALATEALAMARDLGDEGLITACLHNLGNALTNLGELEQSEALLRETIARYRPGEGGRWLHGAMLDLAMTLIYQHRLDLARELSEQVLTAAEAAGDGANVLHALTNLGALHLNAGNMTQATAISGRAQEMAQDFGDLRILSVTLGNLGHAALLDGRRAEALRRYRDTLEISRNHIHSMTVEALLGLAALAAARAPAAGATWLAAGVAWREQTGFGAIEAHLLRLSAETEAHLRAALGADFDVAWARGLAMSLEPAAAEAMAWAEGESYRV